MKKFSPIDGLVSWTPQLVRSELRRFHEHFGTASSEAVQQNYRKLYKAFVRFHKAGEKGFENWKAFVESTGLVLDTTWTREDFLEETRNYYAKHPWRGWSDFYRNKTAAATAFRRHRREWGWERFGEVLDELGIPHKKVKEGPTAKSGRRPSPKEEPTAKSGRRPSPKEEPTVVIRDEEFSVEDVIELLKSPAGPVWWKLGLDQKVRKKLLENERIRETVKKRKL